MAYTLRRTEVGLLAEEIVASGGLLPDDIMLKVVTSKLDALHNRVSAPSSKVLFSWLLMETIALDPGRLPSHYRTR